MKQPEIIQEGQGREAKCRECGTVFRFFLENVWYGGADSDFPLVYCPREGCGRSGLGRTHVEVCDAMKRPAS
jgi:hypothetical protein